MAFIFDHLIAILVGATLLGALLFVQQRGQQSSIETTIRHRAETQTSSFLNTLTRDIENARTSKQITTGLGTWAPDALGSWGNRAFGVHGTDTHTDWIEFVTLTDPDAGAASPLQAVGYRSVATGESVEVGGVMQPLYRVDRYVYTPGSPDWVQRGGSASNLTGFAVRATSLDGMDVTNARMGNAPATVAIQITAAEDALDRKTGDQEATTLTNATRQAMTVRVVNATSTGDAAAVMPTSGLNPIPTFPGIDPPAPPSGGGGGGSSGGGSSSGGGDSGGGGTTSGPTNPDLNGVIL